MLTKTHESNNIVAGEYMNIMIGQGHLSGDVTPPSSKSLLHRYILSSALASGESIIENVATSEDVLATLRCASVFGAEWRLENGVLYITGMGGAYRGKSSPRFDCGESGTTLRLVIPVASVLCDGGVFTGGGRLLRRPLKPYLDIFNSNGINYSISDEELRINGTLAAGTYFVPGNVSSQFFSGLMFAMALCRGSSLIVSEGTLESAAYAEMTCEALRLAGINAANTGNEFRVTGGSLRPCRYVAEADWSQAAFWIAANAIGSELRLNGLSDVSIQGDRCALELARMLMRNGKKDMDMSQCPDLLPPMAVIAALGPGGCHFTGCERLRYKESDRVSAVCDTLRALGADINESADEISVTGKKQLDGGVTIDCRNDHRIAMMASIAALGCREPVIISGCECVKKSYPDFYGQFSALGGEVNVC